MLSVLRLDNASAQTHLFSEDPRKLIDYLKAKGLLRSQQDCNNIHSIVVLELLCNGLGKQQEAMFLFGASPLYCSTISPSMTSILTSDPYTIPITKQNLYKQLTYTFDFYIYMILCTMINLQQ